MPPPEGGNASGTEEPLLQRRRHDEDDLATRPPKLPARQLFGIFLSNACNGIQVTLPFTIAVYCVRSFGIKDEVEVGKLTGLLSSLYCLGMFCSSYVWGRVSDAFGRKNVVLSGNLSNTVCVVMFGMANNYTQACLVRFISGLFNGVSGALKSMAAELASADNQASALLFVSMGWGFGTTLGPAIGGVFSNPCEAFGPSFPYCGSGELFIQRPYLLPCLVSSAINAMALVFSCFMDETRRKASAYIPGEGLERSSGQAEAPQPATVDEEQRIQEPGLGSDWLIGTPIPWWKVSAVRVTLLGYSCIAFLYTMWDEVNPIYASSPLVNGGLGLKTRELGIALTVGGCTLFFYAMLGYKRMQRYFGVKTLTRYALRASLPVALAFPVISTFAVSSKIQTMLSLTLIFVVRSMVGTSIFTSSAMMINMSAPQGSIGAVNGFGMTVVSLLRGLGPGLGGWLWSFTLALGIPGHQYITYAFVGLGTLLTSFLYTSILDLPNVKT